MNKNVLIFLPLLLVISKQANSQHSKEISQDKIIEIEMNNKNLPSSLNNFVKQNNQMVSSQCNNKDFEDADFSNWLGLSGDCGTGVVNWTGGLVNSGNNASLYNWNARHTIMTNSGYDPIAINSITGLPEIPFIAPGGSSVSVRLGNAQILYQTEALKYDINVTPTNYNYVYHYALVLEDTTVHYSNEKSTFQVSFLDQNNALISLGAFANPLIEIPSSNDTSYFPFYTNGIGSGTPRGYYRKWHTVIVDLSSYIGSTITVQFRTADCRQGGHFGYAYIDANCNNNVGVSEISHDKPVIAYPNPTNGKVNISLYDNVENVCVSVKNILGQQIFSQKYDYTNEIDIEVEGNNGVYWFSMIYSG